MNDDAIRNATLLGPDGLPIDNPDGIIGRRRRVDPDAMIDSVRFATWHITLAIQHSADNADIHHRVYYIRNPRGNDAVALAIKYWQLWEGPKDTLGQPVPGAWPDIAVFPNEHVAMAIDENDFMNAWKQCKRVREQKKPAAYAGEKERPMHFTFSGSEEWDVINNKANPEVWGKKMKRRGRV